MQLITLRPALTALALLAISFATVSADTNTRASFKSTPAFEREVVGLVGLLENYHYNRNGVRSADYAELIPDFMTELDGQRLFFLESDKTTLMGRYPAKWLYNNLTSLGKVDPAFEIFSLYEQRISSRVAWIQAELAKDIDLTTNETYTIDRTKSPWPATAAEADDLWHRRLKFDVIQEVLNKKPPEEARQKISKRYERMIKNLSELESFEITEMYLSSLTRMYDPHSTYFSSATFEDFGIQMRLQLYGIGALLGIEEDTCTIKELITGGPADLDKRLRPNDKILSVAQGSGEFVDIVGMKLRKIVSLIRGKAGSEVRLLIQPADAADPSERKTVTLTRNIVNLNSARARGGLFEIPQSDGQTRKLGVITLPSFYGPDSQSQEGEQHSATGDVAKLISQLQTAGMEGLVLDLRNNGGGLLSEATDLAGLFIKTGPVVQIRDHYGNVKVDKDENPAIAYSGPLTVLVSKFSASASEIVAGALQNYGRAIIIGDSSTHGKGSVQTVIDMRNLLDPSVIRLADNKVGATKLTVQKFYLPDGHSTQLKGVIPDLVMPSFEDYLPVGEKDLPHALIWDEIPSSYFDGKPLEKDYLTTLLAESSLRQKQLEEFSYLQKSIDWFKSKQEQKEISLNIDVRRKQKETDAAFHKSMKEEKERLSQNAFTMQEFYLGTPPAPKPKITPKDGDEDADLVSSDDNGSYSKMDIHLREALRVLADMSPKSPAKNEVLAHTQHASPSAARPNMNLEK